MKKKEQHIVPRTYLKHWRITDNQNFVYGVDFSNKYKKGVQTFGLNDKVFKENKYYNDNSFENPYIIEDILGKDIEPDYEIIMNEIKSEQNLSIPVREKIIQWLYFSKMRSPYIRNNTERISNFMFKTIEKLNKSNYNQEIEHQIEIYSKEFAKKVQLSAFSDVNQAEKLLSLYAETLNSKHWTIIKSIPEFEFWTNDNPGFSPNTIDHLAKSKPYHPVMELNESSIVIYPLSPKYCLIISPFKKGTPLNICALNMDIEYNEATPELIDYINKGVFYTRNKIIIGTNKEILAHCIRTK